MCKGLFFVFLIGAFKDPRGHLITVQKINNKKKTRGKWKYTQNKHERITAKQGKNRLRWNHDEEYAIPK